MRKIPVRIVVGVALVAVWTACGAPNATTDAPSGDDAGAGADPSRGGVVRPGGSTGDSDASVHDATATDGGATVNVEAGGAIDAFAAQRDAVVAEINKLRKAKGLPDFTRWLGGEACADLQAEDDSKTNIPHNAWRTGKFGCPGGRNENECPGWGGPTCVDAMWGESMAPACASCDTCSGDHGCDGCDFYGTITGTVCGHYENLSATSYTKVAVGFGGGWMLINFD